MSEVLTVRYNIRFLKETDASSIPSPFKVPAAVQSIFDELNLTQSGTMKRKLDHRDRIKVAHSSFLIHDIFAHHCLSCRTCSALSIPQLSQRYPETCTSGEVRPRIHCLLLSDCSDVVSSMMQRNPKSRERTNRSAFSHLEDIQQFLNVSSVCAALNMADLGAKMGGASTCFDRFLSLVSSASDS